MAAAAILAHVQCRNRLDSGGHACELIRAKICAKFCVANNGVVFSSLVISNHKEALRPLIVGSCVSSMKSTPSKATLTQLQFESSKLEVLAFQSKVHCSG